MSCRRSAPGADRHRVVAEAPRRDFRCLGHVHLGGREALPPEKRAAIIAGTDTSSFVPLLNPPPLTLPAPKPTGDIDETELVDLVRMIGVSRIIDAAVAVEAAQ